MIQPAEYPPDAYTPDGQLWWTVTTRPGTKQRFGQEARLAAWLWFALDIGDTFTLPQAREALGGGLESSQHFDRRLRTLRGAGWVIPSGKDTGEGLRNDEYRLDQRGVELWIPEKRATIQRFAPSPKVRRLVFERDGHRCKICGIAAGESYPGEGITKARLTVGHRIPQERLRVRAQRDDIDNWRTECARCNETVRDAIPDPRTFEEVLPHVKSLKREEKAEIAEWLRAGEKRRATVDIVWDEVRMLSRADQERMVIELDGFSN